MRLHNNSNRILPLGGNVRIMPNADVVLQADARHLIERPLVKAYLADKTLTLTGGTTRGATAGATAAAAPAKAKAPPKDDATAKASTGDAAKDPIPSKDVKAET